MLKCYILLAVKSHFYQYRYFVSHQYIKHSLLVWLLNAWVLALGGQFAVAVFFKSFFNLCLIVGCSHYEMFQVVHTDTPSESKEDLHPVQQPLPTQASTPDSFMNNLKVNT